MRRHARSLGLSVNQFLALVRAWREHGRAVAISDTGAARGTARADIPRSLPSASKDAARQVIAALQPDAPHADVVRAVNARCAALGVTAPSPSTIWNMVMSARRDAAPPPGGGGIMVSLCNLKLPTVIDDEIVFPAITLVVDAAGGAILAASLSGLSSITLTELRPILGGREVVIEATSRARTASTAPATVRRRSIHTTEEHQMSEIDFSGVDPLRLAGTRRRIEVVRNYLSIKKPRATDREAAARTLGIGPQQFMNLVRAWRLQGSAAAIANAGAQAGGPRTPRKRGLPPLSRAAAEEALRDLPASATHKAAIAAVHALCEQRGTRPPSDSMISYLRLTVRRSGTAADGEPGIVIGRAIAGLPMLEVGAVTLPELVIVASTADGRVISSALLAPRDAAPADIAIAVGAENAALAGPVTIGVDDEALAATFPLAKVVSRFAAGRILAKAIGRGIDGVRLSYGPLASSDPKRLLRAKADEPLTREDALAALMTAMIAHNAARGAPPPHVDDPRLTI